jgi:hypothetical protein
VRRLGALDLGEALGKQNAALVPERGSIRLCTHASQVLSVLAGRFAKLLQLSADLQTFQLASFRHLVLLERNTAGISNGVREIRLFRGRSRGGSSILFFLSLLLVLLSGLLLVLLLRLAHQGFLLLLSVGLTSLLLFLSAELLTRHSSCHRLLLLLLVGGVFADSIRNLSNKIILKFCLRAKFYPDDEADSVVVGEAGSVMPFVAIGCFVWAIAFAAAFGDPDFAEHWLFKGDSQSALIAFIALAASAAACSCFAFVGAYSAFCR